MKNQKTEVIETLHVRADDSFTVKTPTAELGKGPLLGRPVNPFSERQRKINDLKNRKALNGGFLPLGRPVVEGSARQQKLATKGTNPAGQKGRPKMTEEAKLAARAERTARYEAWKATQGAIPLHI